MEPSAHTFMPICTINPCNRFVTLMVWLMWAMFVRLYGRRILWKVIFMDYQVLYYYVQQSPHRMHVWCLRMHSIFFLVWWDFWHHRGRCRYYSMEILNQCWQGLPQIRTLGWCCYRWRTECGYQPVQISFHAENDTSWCHRRMSGYSVPAPTSVRVIHRGRSTYMDTW